MKASTQWIIGIIAVVFLGVCILLSGGIYTTVNYGGILYKTNRFTGESEFIVGSTSARAFAQALVEAGCYLFSDNRSRMLKKKGRIPPPSDHAIAVYCMSQ